MRCAAADLSLVVSFGEDSTSDVQLSYAHTLTMQSPAISLDVEACLELLFTAQSPFHIRLSCVDFSGTYSERTLYTSRQPLGLKTHKIQLPLPATTSDYSNCSLAFEVKTMSTGVAAVFSNIAVLPSQCPPTSQ